MLIINYLKKDTLLDSSTASTLSIILGIIPLVIGMAKFLFSTLKKKGLFNNYGKTDIGNIRHILENSKLGALEKNSLNESLIQAEFKQIYGIPFNKYNRQRVILSEKLSLGEITVHDFHKAKGNIFVKGNNIIFHKPPVFSYQAWATIQKSGKVLSIIVSASIFIYLSGYIIVQATETKTLNETFSRTFGSEQYLFLIIMVIFYICLAVFMNQLYINTQSTIKVKKYLDRTKNMMIRNSLPVLPNVNTIYLISPHSLKFKTVGHKLFCSKIGNSPVYTACHYANYN